LDPEEKCKEFRTALDVYCDKWDSIENNLEENGRDCYQLIKIPDTTPEGHKIKITISQETHQTTENKYQISTEPICSDSIKNPALAAKKKIILDEIKQRAEDEKNEPRLANNYRRSPDLKPSIHQPTFKSAGFYY
jgi:hypothetical protein